MMQYKYLHYGKEKIFIFAKTTIMKQLFNLLVLLTLAQSYAQDSIASIVVPVSDTHRPKKTLQETKDFIVRVINDYGWEKDSDTRRLKASFEGNLLRVVVMNKKYTEPVNSGLVYNFGRVHKFQRISYRGGDIAFLNIWVDFLSNEKSRKFDKRKLVLEIHHHRQAEELMTAFRHLNDLLLEMEEPVEKF